MAQNIILCQFCEISFEITWKCFNCDLVPCSRCTKNHSKFGGSEDHCIIDLNKIGSPENVEIIRKFNLRNIRCTTHKEERCPLFCKDCNKPVCSFCVIESEHRGHNIDKLITVYNNQLSDLKDIKERIEKNYSDLKISVKESTSTSDNYNEIKEKIIQREKEIKEKVSEQAAFLINELDKLIVPSKDAFMEEKQRIQERESKVKDTNKLIDEALQSHQATYVLETIRKVDKHLQLNVNADNIPLHQKFMFTVPDSLSINFGSVKECPMFRIINTYETNVPCIEKLKSLKNGTLVFFYEKGRNEFIEYCDIQGDQCIFKYKTCIVSFIGKGKGKVHNMTVTEDDIILVTSDWGSNSNKILCMNAYENNLKTSNFAAILQTNTI
ncbi:E3 ubiquitin-protein ligase TRIM36-like [Mytilus californianus]|uniref:E3 ubiquitin-protein ligase TRIM36-like n=1 Tax=Mytilus californianus TaxID=6549 RepID=UPI00224651DD|nr:E3 ubiquitin-protein ligase TRIM36-like [Mytilus californianus]